MSNYGFTWQQHQRYKNETHLSTFGHPAQAHTWFSGSHGNSWWTRSYSRPSCQGASSPSCLNGRTPRGVTLKKDTSFPRKYRLTKTDEFSSVFSFRKAVKGRHFILHFRVRPKDLEDQKNGARLGMVVPKRLVRRAVQRNLIRRIVRENFRIMRDGLNSVDMVVRLCSKPSGLDRKTFSLEIKSLFEKMSSLRQGA